MAITSRHKLYTADQLARMLVPVGGDFTLAHVAGAFEELVKWELEHGEKVATPKQYGAAVVREIRQMNMAAQSCNSIVAKLSGIRFSSQWVFPTFDSSVAGFKIKKLRRGKR